MAQGLPPYLMATDPDQQQNAVPTLDQLMAQMNQAGTQANIPQDPQMPTQPMPPQAAVDMVKNQLAPNLPKPMPQRPTIPPQVIQQAKANQWEDNVKKTLAEQDAGVGGLEKYLQEMQSEPRGINYTPLAALLDSTIPGSHLTAAAQAMAPQSEEKRQEDMFKLADLIQQRKSNLAQNAVKPYKDQLDMLTGMLKAQAQQDRWGTLGGVRQDNQTMQAVDRITKDKTLVDYQNRLEGANRIQSQLQAVRDGKMVDTNQFLNDLNTEYVNLLTNSNNAALGKQERTEYRTAAGNLSSALQQISAHPESIHSDAILRQIESGIVDLKGSYRRAVDKRVDLLQRQFPHNPQAQSEMGRAGEDFKNQYGTKGLEQEPQVPERKVYEGKTYEKQGGSWVEVE